MATLYIEEYQGIATGADGAQVPAGYITQHKITIAGTTARTSTDFDSECELLVLTADADCQFELGNSSVNATATSRPVLSGTSRAISRDGNERIAAIEKQ